MNKHRVTIVLSLLGALVLAVVVFGLLRDGAGTLGVDRVIGEHSLPYVGDSGTMIFHTQQCSKVQSIRKSDRLYFKSCDAAISRGFLRCEVCNPCSEGWREGEH